MQIVFVIQYKDQAEQIFVGLNLSTKDYHLFPALKKNLDGQTCRC